MKFNQPTQKTETRTTNYEGGVAYKMSPELELYQRTATCLVNEPKFYGDTSTELDNIRTLIQKVAQRNPEYILALATYVRHVLNLRTISTVMLVEASLLDSCKPYVRQYAPHVLMRPDQTTDALAYLKTRIGDLGNLKAQGSIPSSLKRGIADSFVKFSEYQLAKYNSDNEFKLRDVLKLTHPRPQDREQSLLFESVLNNTVKPADTWEVLISTEGSNKETWTRASIRMPYMALLRNLRNFLEHGVDMQPILDRIADREAVLKSKQLPFRFVAAYNAVRSIPSSTSTITALDMALEHSAENLPVLRGTTAIAADHSGSMFNALSAKSDILRVQTADTMLAFAHKLAENPITMIYGASLNTFQVSQRGSMLETINKLNGINLGGTNTYLVPQYLLQNNIKVDRIIIPTDEQSYGGSFYNTLLEYRRQVNPNCYCYLINLAGYGTTEVPENDPKTMMIAGFSERVFEFINIFESDMATSMKAIDNYYQ